MGKKWLSERIVFVKMHLEITAGEELQLEHTVDLKHFSEPTVSIKWLWELTTEHKKLLLRTQSVKW